MSSNMNPYGAPTSMSNTSEPPGRSLAWLFFSFDGRASRWDYWKATLLLMLLMVGATMAMTVTMVPAVHGEANTASTLFSLLGFAMIPLVWSSLAISVKRWHDRDKSGWWIFIGMIPLIGPVWSFIETGCLRGTMGDNSYGHDPVD